MDNDTLVNNPEACGMGRGDACCAFLTMGAGGTRCARGTGLDALLRGKVERGEMRSRRLPTEPRPDCQLAT